MEFFWTWFRQDKQDHSFLAYNGGNPQNCLALATRVSTLSKEGEKRHLQEEGQTFPALPQLFTSLKGATHENAPAPFDTRTNP